MQLSKKEANKELFFLRVDQLIEDGAELGYKIPQIFIKKYETFKNKELEKGR